MTSSPISRHHHQIDHDDVALCLQRRLHTLRTILLGESWCKSVKDVARDKLDAKSVKCTFIGYGSDEMGYRFWDSKGHKVVRSKDVTFNEDSLYRAKAATDSSNLTKPKQKDQVVLEDSLENLTNKSIVAEHGLNSEITQSPEHLEGGFERGDSHMVTDDPPESSRAKVKEEQDGRKRLVLSIVASEDLHLEQLDVKTAFLHGDLDEDIYLIQLEGFQSVGKEENLLCKLKKSLYGLKHRDNASDMAEIKKLKRQLPVIAHVVGVVSIFMSKPMEGALGSCSSGARLLDRSESFVNYEAEYMALYCAGKSECYSSREESSVSWSNEAHQDKISLHPVSEETLYLKKIIGAKNPADMLTKVVTTEKLKLYATSTGL
ncbi:retrovirus-related pol polyprotein from transposon TNT 1-94 [Tanacetum coccineum]